MMSTKHIIKETKKRLKKKTRRLAPDVVEKIERDIVDVEKHYAVKSKKKLEAAKKRLFADVKQHLPKKFLEVVKEYAISIVVAVLIALTIRHFIIEPFKIPSGSMIPTLEIKDKIVVNKFIYGPKIPFTHKRFLWQNRPERWDIVVFTTHGIDKASAYPKNFVKRVVGLPGDEIEIKDGEIYVNGELEEMPKWMQEHGIRYTYAPPDRPAGYVKMDYYINLFGLRLIAKKNSYLSVQKGRWEVGYKGQRFKVPLEHYFVLGDNSSSSYDSRGWGFVPYDNIKGKVIYIWWPLARIHTVR